MQSWLCVPSVVRSVSRSVLRMCSDVRSDVCVFLRLRRQVGHQEVPFLPPRPLFTLQTRRRPSDPCQHTQQIHPRCRRKPTPAAYEGTSPPIPILYRLEKRQISPYPDALSRSPVSDPTPDDLEDDQCSNYQATTHFISEVADITNSEDHSHLKDLRAAALLDPE